MFKCDYATRTFLLLFLVSLHSNTSFANDGDFQFQTDEKLTSRNPSFVEIGIPESTSSSDLLDGLSIAEDSKLWFGSFIFGNANPKAISILKVDDDGSSILYIDTNRNQKLSDETPIAKSPVSNQWNLELQPPEDSSSGPQQKIRIVFSWDNQKETLKKTTAGVMAGKAMFAGEQRIVKLVDFNHNGVWLDPDDRILVDINGNGKTSRITEQFPCAGMLKIREELYAIQGDSSGSNVKLTPVTAKGQIVASVNLADELGFVKDIKAVLRSKSGIQVVLDDIDKPVVCPIGNYQVSELSISVVDSKQHYWFQFLRSGTGDYDFKVSDNEQSSIELLENLRLEAQVTRIAGQGEDVVSVTPALYTDCGMYLSNAKVGEKAAISENRLRMNASSESSLTRAGSSGFS